MDNKDLSPDNAEKVQSCSSVRLMSEHYVRYYEDDDGVLKWTKLDDNGDDLNKENSLGVLYHVGSLFVPHGCQNPLSNPNG